MRRFVLAGFLAICGAWLLLWLPRGGSRHAKPHPPAVIRFEPPVHNAPPVKRRILLRPKVA